MTERDVENLLGRWYHEQVDENLQAPQSLRSRVAAIPDTTARRGAMPSRPLMLVAAATLLSTTLIAFIAAGGLQRPQVAIVAEPSPRATVLASPILSPPPASPGVLTAAAEPFQSCNISMDDDILVHLTPTSVRDAAQVIVFDNGHVVTGSMRPLGLDDSWRQRRLTVAGIETLTAAVAAAGLPRCERLYAGAEVPNYQLAARIDGGVLGVYVSDRGHRRLAEGQVASLRGLVEQIVDLDSLIPADLWMDEAWQEYGPDRWQLKVTFAWDDFNLCVANAPKGQECPPSGYLLPDGTDLAQFGTYYPAWLGRCGHLTVTEADRAVQFLELATTKDDPFPEGAYEGSFTLDNSWGFDVDLRGLLPHQTECQTQVQAPAEPLPTPADAVADTDPCRYIPPTSIAPSVWTELGLSHRNDYGIRGHWARCYFYASSGDLDMYVRVRQTSSADADSYVRSAFGEIGLTTEEIAGRSVYFNGCFEATSGCRPAIAVSAAPYLVIATTNWHENRDELRLVAESIISEGLLGEDPSPSP